MSVPLAEESERAVLRSRERAFKWRHVCGILVPAVLAAAAFAVPAANAGSDRQPAQRQLPDAAARRSSRPWADCANYILAPNGSFEFGTQGWSLSGGAGVVSGNEPFYPTGSHSLSLPSGSSAMSPTVCLGTKQLYIRMFGKDLGGTDSGLRVRVFWYGLLNQLLGSADFAVFPGGGDWAPTSQVQSSGGLLAPLPVVALLVVVLGADPDHAARRRQPLADRRPLHRSLHQPHRLSRHTSARKPSHSCDGFPRTVACMATKTATPWGPAELVEELTVRQQAGERRFASIVQLLETANGERLVRFAYSTDGTARRGPVTLRQRDVERMRAGLAKRPGARGGAGA